MKRLSSSASPKSSDDFAAEAQRGAPGIVREFVQFLRHDRKWWLAPVFLVLLMIGALVVLGTSGGAPLIYTMF